jgi:hypothetical protein
MTDFSQEQTPELVQTTPKDWLVAYGTTLLVLLVLGILPRLI